MAFHVSSREGTQSYTHLDSFGVWGSEFRGWGFGFGV